ncbi:hypothetical protein PV783_13875 [Chitinophaga sp. CC14]|uniref:lanthionine synthetase LanC family protein n=1 Tax=Chitinophaga sp. CC14 TaxID=3029199 RepID=UPI003B7778D0
MAAYLSESIEECTRVAPAGENIGYERFLDQKAITCLQKGPYLLVGDQGPAAWQIHISVVACQVEQMLSRVIPLLVKGGLGFRMVRDRLCAEQILIAGYGHERMGKMVTVFAGDGRTACDIAGRLILSTEDLRGPAVTGAYFLAGTVYTTYHGPGTMPCAWPEQQMDGKRLLKYFDSLTFRLPPNVPWPFDTIRKYRLAARGGLVKGKYLVTTILKSDVKGNVLKAFYFSKGWPAYCVIKEGKGCINEDLQGRDAASRITWQWQVYQRLKDLVCMPAHLDYFHSDGKAFLVTKFIRSESLERRVERLLLAGVYENLSKDDKLHLTGLLLSIFEMVAAMHKEGFVHRDITPFNFVVDSSGRLYALDLELCYDLKGAPYPPLLKGTPGYMSTEQQMAATPTPAEDIYALGALIIFVLTGLYPNHFTGPGGDIKEGLNFFLADDALCHLVACCLDSRPDRRPEIGELAYRIRQFREKPESIGPERPKYSDADLLEVVCQGLAGLHFPGMFDGQGYWKGRRDDPSAVFSGQGKWEVTLPGLFNGVSGVLFTVFSAMRLGVSWTYDEMALRRNFSFVLDHVTGKGPQLSPGLAEGVCGIALMLNQAVLSGAFGVAENMVKSPLTYQDGLLDDWQNANLSLSDGIAGIALGQLSICRDGLPAAGLLCGCIEVICCRQRAGGNWQAGREGGFFKGDAGILWALLSYLVHYPDERTGLSAIKGLSRLCGKQRAKERNPWLWGQAGLCLTLLKAARVFGENRYQVAAEKILTSYPDKITSNCLALGEGISGLGEIYLSAWQLTGKDRWRDRATWIAQVLAATFYRPEKEKGYWLTDRTFLPSGGLMEGSCGPIHFLLRYLYPEKLSLPGF